MTALRIGSLCSGYGGLDMAITDVFGGTVAWHAQYEPPDKHGREDKNQYPSQILAHRYPGVPNHGDITRADWFDVEPVDILGAGFPCQPVSNAGLQKGVADARWIWPAVAQSIRLLRPRLVVLENVAALLVRGLPIVLADLARLGYVGSWTCLRASDVGAPHHRNRIFILARAAANTGRHTRSQNNPNRPVAGRRGGAAADTEGLGHGLHGELPPGRNALQLGLRTDAVGRRTAVSDTEGNGRHQGRPEPAWLSWRPDAAIGSDSAASDPDGEPVRNEPVAESGGRGTSVAGLDWGAYGPAIARWERVLGRPAPAPVDERGRLAPRFVEWMMGAPDGWVTDVPDVPRSAQLKALGNGVVRQQGAAAIRILVERAELAAAT